MKEHVAVEDENTIGKQRAWSPIQMMCAYILTRMSMQPVNSATLLAPVSRSCRDSLQPAPDATLSGQPLRRMDNVHSVIPLVVSSTERLRRCVRTAEPFDPMSPQPYRGRTRGQQDTRTPCRQDHVHSRASSLATLIRVQESDEDSMSTPTGHRLSTRTRETVQRPHSELSERKLPEVTTGLQVCWSVVIVSFGCISIVS